MCANRSQRHLPLDRRGAFTLIELLVVVSIIALLISILLPSLKAARESAKTVVCSSTQKGISSSNAIYHGIFNDWLVGAPGTSGSALLRHPDRDDWNDDDTRLTFSAQYLVVPNLQVWDWASPLESIQEPPLERPDYYKVLADRNRCASNRFVARPVVGAGQVPGGDWRAIQAPSYYTVRSLLVWPNDSRSAPYNEAKAGPAGAGGEGEGDGWELPDRYAPRLDRLGAPSRKVFLTDGSRWTDAISGAVTYNIEWSARSGGCFSTGGASLRYADSDDPQSYLRDFFLSSNADTRSSAPVTYRHKKGSKLGVAATFYDGHAAWLSEDESRHPDYWWPKGTEVDVTKEINDPARWLVVPYSGGDQWYTVQ